MKYEYEVQQVMITNSIFNQISNVWIVDTLKMSFKKPFPPQMWKMFFTIFLLLSRFFTFVRCLFAQHFQK